MNFSKEIKIARVMNAVAAGTTDQTSTAVDMQGFEGVCFVLALGAIATDAVTSMKAQQDTASAMSNATDLTGTGVTINTTDDNKVVYLDVYKPRERYVQAIVDRGTGTVVIDSMTAYLYGAKKTPVTHDSTTVAGGETHASPAEGTA